MVAFALLLSIIVSGQAFGQVESTHNTQKKSAIAPEYLAVYLISEEVPISGITCEGFSDDFDRTFLAPLDSKYIELWPHFRCGSGLAEIGALIFAADDDQLQMVQTYVAMYDNKKLHGHRFRIHKIEKVVYNLTISAYYRDWAAHLSSREGKVSFHKTLDSFNMFQRFLSDVVKPAISTGPVEGLVDFIADNTDANTATVFAGSMSRANLVQANGYFSYITDDNTAKKSISYTFFERDCRIYPHGYCLTAK